MEMDELLSKRAMQMGEYFMFSKDELNKWLRYSDPLERDFIVGIIIIIII